MLIVFILFVVVISLVVASLEQEREFLGSIIDEFQKKK